ncbi:uncharacterized protein G2W53_014460 [Senna tora]|uniref:Uncharacterized protein n=1 Tax=Senna tora TaxID=362788 RepID=A0A835C839_9FABA|nr:uncharacterized protein G2W53_014460 [Senna tora]
MATITHRNRRITVHRRTAVLSTVVSSFRPLSHRREESIEEAQRSIHQEVIHDIVDWILLNYVLFFFLPFRFSFVGGETGDRFDFRFLRRLLHMWLQVFGFRYGAIRDC